MDTCVLLDLLRLGIGKVAKENKGRREEKKVDQEFCLLDLSRFPFCCTKGKRYRKGALDLVCSSLFSTCSIYPPFPPVVVWSFLFLSIETTESIECKEEREGKLHSLHHLQYKLYLFPYYYMVSSRKLYTCLPHASSGQGDKSLS